MNALPAIAHRLAEHSVAETNSLLVSSARQHGVSLTERTDWRVSYEKPDGTIVPAGIVKAGWVAEAATPAELDAVERKVLTGMAPPERDQVAMWIAELSVITARREDDHATESLRLAAYVSRLRDYPADVVREALLTRRWKFFPTWSELGMVCDDLVKPRRDMLASLERARNEAQRRERSAGLVSPGKYSQTTEERRATAASLGSILAEMRQRAAAEAQAQPADAPKWRGPEVEAGE